MFSFFVIESIKNNFQEAQKSLENRPSSFRSHRVTRYWLFKSSSQKIYDLVSRDIERNPVCLNSMFDLLVIEVL